MVTPEWAGRRSRAPLRREHGGEHIDLISVNDEHHRHFYTSFGMYEADNLRIMGKHFAK